MAETLYTTDILRLATRIPGQGRSIDAHSHAVRTSRLCGSRLTLAVRAEAGKVSDFSQEVKACALGQAACAIAGSAFIGTDLAEAEAISRTFQAMIEGDQNAFATLDARDDGWRDLVLLQPVAEHRSRRGSVMLPLDALIDALSDLEQIPSAERTLSSFTR